jgi:hypothetical protein
VTFAETCERAIAICQNTEGTDKSPLVAFEEAGWEVVFSFYGETGRVKLWEDAATTAFNARLKSDYARDMGQVFNTLYRGRTPEERRQLAREVGITPDEADTWQDPALYYIGGRTGSTVRAAIFAPGQKPNNPFLYG